MGTGGERKEERWPLQLKLVEHRRPVLLPPLSANEARRGFLLQSPAEGGLTLLEWVLSLFMAAHVFPTHLPLILRSF